MLVPFVLYRYYRRLVERFGETPFLGEDAATLYDYPKPQINSNLLLELNDRGIVSRDRNWQKGRACGKYSYICSTPLDSLDYDRDRYHDVVFDEIRLTIDAEFFTIDDVAAISRCSRDDVATMLSVYVESGTLSKYQIADNGHKYVYSFEPFLSWRDAERRYDEQVHGPILPHIQLTGDEWLRYSLFRDKKLIHRGRNKLVDQQFEYERERFGL